MIHERLLYIGDLSGLTARGQRMFLWRIERLLNGQFTAVSEDEAVESQAQYFYGKYFQKHRLGEKRASLKAAEGGLLLRDREERINLKSFIPLEIRETGAEWLCWQALEHLGILDFLKTHPSWSAKEQELMLLNPEDSGQVLMGRLLHPVSERKTGFWANEQSCLMPMLTAVSEPAVQGQSLRWRPSSKTSILRQAC